MDKLKNAFKKLKISTTVAAIALIVIGLMFIIFPDREAHLLCSRRASSFVGNT